MLSGGVVCGSQRWRLTSMNDFTTRDQTPPLLTSSRVRLVMVEMVFTRGRELMFRPLALGILSKILRRARVTPDELSDLL